MIFSNPAYNKKLEKYIILQFEIVAVKLIRNV